MEKHELVIFEVKKKLSDLNLKIIKENKDSKNYYNFYFYEYVLKGKNFNINFTIKISKSIKEENYILLSFRTEEIKNKEIYKRVEATRYLTEIEKCLKEINFVRIKCLLNDRYVEFINISFKKIENEKDFLEKTSIDFFNKNKETLLVQLKKKLRTKKEKEEEMNFIVNYDIQSELFLNFLEENNILEKTYSINQAKYYSFAEKYNYKEENNDILINEFNKLGLKDLGTENKSLYYHYDDYDDYDDYGYYDWVLDEQTDFLQDITLNKRKDKNAKKDYKKKTKKRNGGK